MASACNDATDSSQLVVIDLCGFGSLRDVTEAKDVYLDFCCGSVVNVASNTLSNSIPLFLCDSLDQLCKDGFHIPEEFVIETGRIPNPDYEANSGEVAQNLCSVACENLYKRIDLLKRSKGRVSCVDVRDWCAGVFRRYLFLDSQVHGTAGTMDLKEVRFPKPNSRNEQEEQEKSVKMFCSKWFSPDRPTKGGMGNEKQDSQFDDTQRKNKRILRTRFTLHGDKGQNNRKEFGNVAKFGMT